MKRLLFTRGISRARERGRECPAVSGTCPGLAVELPVLAESCRQLPEWARKWPGLSPVLRGQTGFGGRAGFLRLSLCSRQVM